MDDFFREMFLSLACAIAIRVRDGVFFFFGLYSGRDTIDEVFFGLWFFFDVNIFGRVKITVFWLVFTSFMSQPMFSHVLL